MHIYSHCPAPQSMDDFHRRIPANDNLSHSFFLSRLLNYNAEIWNQTASLRRPKPINFTFKNQKLLVGTLDEDNNRNQIVKSFHTIPAVIYGSNTENIGIITKRNKDTVFDSFHYAYDSAIIDLEVRTDDTKVLVTQRGHIDLLDPVRAQAEALLQFPFATRSTFHPTNRLALASVSKENLAVFDLRDLRNIVLGDFNSIKPSIAIKRKSVNRQQPLYKPSDMTWANETTIAVSSRSSSHIQLYDVRFMKNPTNSTKSSVSGGVQSAIPKSAKYRDSYNFAYGGGIEKLQVDPNTGFVYGITYGKNTIKVFTPSTSELLFETRILETYNKGSGFQIVPDALGYSTMLSANTTATEKEPQFDLVSFTLPQTAAGFEYLQESLAPQVFQFGNVGRMHDFCYNQQLQSVVGAFAETWQYQLENYEEQNVLIKFFERAE